MYQTTVVQNSFAQPPPMEAMLQVKFEELMPLFSGHRRENVQTSVPVNEEGGVGAHPMNPSGGLPLKRLPCIRKRLVQMVMLGNRFVI